MKLVPLLSISPSNFESLRKCALQVVLERTLPQGVLPPTVYMLVGSLIHRVAEQAFIEEAPATQPELEQIWQRVTEVFEAQLLSRTTTAPMVPLRYSVPNFAVRRALFLRTWKYRTAPSEPKSGSLAQGGAEKALADNTKQVSGKADLLLRTASGWVIKDFKSGQVIDSETGDIKSEYATQLKLYAALCKHTYGEFPVQLLLIDATGEEIDVPFTPDESLSLLAEARQLLAAVNQGVADGQVEQLASPEPERCGWCRSRAMCPVYIGQVRLNPENTVSDFIGVLISYKMFNDRLQLVLEAGNIKRQLTSVGTMSKRLYAQLDTIAGGEVLVCNARPTPNRLTFTATDITCAVPVGGCALD
jgi:RecB family exonuclease